MRALIREYLASLRERDELDAILPDLLSELGYTVFSRPARGVAQYGVDVGAVGPSGDERVYLFSIKRGDLTRSDWDNSTPQALRSSLNQIKDVYIPTHLPPEYRNRNVVICPCFGGGVHQSLQMTLSNFLAENSNVSVTFEIWDGDRLANYIERGYLNERLLSGKMRSDLRKAIALLDEPEASFAHFSSLTRALVADAEGKPDTAGVTAARQICICLWMVFVWAREVGNLESPYLSSEFALLHAWHALRRALSGANAMAAMAGGVLQHLVDLHFQIWHELIGKKILPHCGERDALSAAVHSQSPLDINLKLFDILGRLALRGLWLLWSEPNSDALPAPWNGGTLKHEMALLADRIVALVAVNGALSSPVRDDHAIELSLAFMFLSAHGGYVEFMGDWIRGLASRYEHAHNLHKRYPCIYTDYRDLAEHPKATEDYRKDATAGSVLLPTLALWAGGTANVGALKTLSKFRKEQLQHCTLQLWIPDDVSEAHLYRNDSEHGASFTDIPVESEGRPTLEYVLRECGLGTPFFALSAIDQGFWPILMVACRHYRLPIPPHIVMRFLSSLEAVMQRRAPAELEMEFPRASRVFLMQTTACTPIAP